MPRAIAALAYGGPENIGIIEVPSRPAGPGEVVIQVRAAGLNPVDAKNAAGRREADPAKLPLRLGFEASGVIAAVGDGAIGADGAQLKAGDEVVAFRVSGGIADELTVPAKDVLIKPSGLGFPEAAGLLLVATTAEHALQRVNVSAGDVVLIHGAGGSVGLAAVQLAVRRGARVIATAAEHRHEWLRSLGAEPIAYGPGLEDRVRALTDHVDAAIDTAGTQEAYDVSLSLVPDRDRLVTIANGPAFVEAGAHWIGGGPGAEPGKDIRDGARAELVRLAATGELVVPVVATFPFTQATEAYTLITGGHAGGKVVLVP